MNDLSRNKKYLQLTETARKLFWKHGFRRVSVEEICRDAGVSKMTFYRFFPNKLELAKTVYDRVVDEGMTRFKKILAEDSPAAEKMKKILRMKMEGTHEISREFLTDFYTGQETGLKAHIEEKTKRAWSEIVNDIRNGQDKGWFRRDMKPEFFLLYSQKLIGLINDENLQRLYGSPQELIMELANFVTYGIAPRE